MSHHLVNLFIILEITILRFSINSTQRNLRVRRMRSLQFTECFYFVKLFSKSFHLQFSLHITTSTALTYFPVLSFSQFLHPQLSTPMLFLMMRVFALHIQYVCGGGRLGGKEQMAQDTGHSQQKKRVWNSAIHQHKIVLLFESKKFQRKSFHTQNRELSRSHEKHEVIQQESLFFFMAKKMLSTPSRFTYCKKFSFFHIQKISPNFLDNTKLNFAYFLTCTRYYFVPVILEFPMIFLFFSRTKKKIFFFLIQYSPKKAAHGKKRRKRVEEIFFHFFLIWTNWSCCCYLWL